MHPIGQILSVIDRREFQNRTIYACPNSCRCSKIDKNEGSEVVDVIDKYIICALPNETNIWK